MVQMLCIAAMQGNITTSRALPAVLKLTRLAPNYERLWLGVREKACRQQALACQLWTYMLVLNGHWRCTSDHCVRKDIPAV